MKQATKDAIDSTKKMMTHLTDIKELLREAQSEISSFKTAKQGQNRDFNLLKESIEMYDAKS